MKEKKTNLKALVLFMVLVTVWVWNIPLAMGQALPGGTLDPTTIPKYEESLIIPQVMPPVSEGYHGKSYRVGMRQFEQAILPESMGLSTKVFGYGPADDETNENFLTPAFTIEAKVNEMVSVDWVNQLVDENGNFLPHLLPVDPTLHWANPPGGEMHKDMRPEFSETPGPYLGPVPTVAHLHGAHVADHSDGYPEAWYLPAAVDIPADYATKGTHYDSQDGGDLSTTTPGKSLFQYTNDQRATTLWYHDHTLGMTRTNVYAGLAGFWLIRDEKEKRLNLPGPAARPGDPQWEPQNSNDAPPYGEIPIVIQDRSFNEDGSLFYPDTREFFDGYAGPYVPDTEIPPLWNPEFFGNTMMVNGRTWPYLNVEPKKYRFRLLNGCNSRFLILKLDQVPAGVSCFVEGAGSMPAPKVIKFNQIGNDGGLIPGKPVVLDQLLMGPAERADVIVDFSKLAPGTEVIMVNLGPDEPFGGLPVDVPSDPETTGQVMKFKVVPKKGKDFSNLPDRLPWLAPLPDHTTVRNLTLNEHAHMPTPTDPDPLFDGPVAALLGTADLGPLMWMDDITETPNVGDTEIWRVINLTEDAHPIHLHLVQFEVIGRAAFDAEGYETAVADGLNPNLMDYVDENQPLAPPEAWEAGTKDTFIVYPGEYAELKATFDLAGLYVWHCHILEHEDNEMMRPYTVLP